MVRRGATGGRPGWTGAAIAAGLAMALTLAGADAQARPKRLNAGEAESLLRGNTVVGYNPTDDSRYEMFHSATGSVRAKLTNVNGEVSRSGGRWSINDRGFLCLDWDNFHWIDSCAAVFDDDGALTFKDPTGRVVSFGEVLTGNPDDL